jgi:hypothetical protein
LGHREKSASACGNLWGMLQSGIIPKTDRMLGA